uniref:Uncharacterized protein n=1 Tax=Arundo donax TaxID=35708 RepID=A0A0A9CC91_ARUDO
MVCYFWSPFAGLMLCPLWTNL